MQPIIKFSRKKVIITLSSRTAFLRHRMAATKADVKHPKAPEPGSLMY